MNKEFMASLKVFFDKFYRGEFGRMRYGQAYCDHFGISDTELSSASSAEALKIIQRKYC